MPGQVDPSQTSPRRRRPLANTLLAVLVATASLTAYAAEAKTALDEANAPDPYQKVNRALFYVNGALDFLVIRPVSMTYRRVTPRPLRTGLHNIFSNLGEPTIALNDFFQGRGKTGVKTVARFSENTVLGLGGLFDVASQNGLPHHDNDFGITLARTNVKSGPYLFLPILGPATARDAVGFAVNFAIDPFNYLGVAGTSQLGIARAVGGGVDERVASDKEIKTMEASATDVYATVRSDYLQNREADIARGHVDVTALPNFDPSEPIPKAEIVADPEP